MSVQNSDGLSALHLAAWNDDDVLIKRLVNAGADSSISDKDGLTAMLFAVKHGRYNAVKALKEAGADSSVPSSDDGRQCTGPHRTGT